MPIHARQLLPSVSAALPNATLLRWRHRYAYGGEEFWGVGMTGRVWHNYDQTKQSVGWAGMTDFEQGDVLGLLLACNEGTLTIFKNGTRLGVAVARGLRVEQGLCWAVALGTVGDRVRCYGAMTA